MTGMDGNYDYGIQAAYLGLLRSLDETIHNWEEGEKEYNYY